MPDVGVVPLLLTMQPWLVALTPLGPSRCSLVFGTNKSASGDFGGHLNFSNSLLCFANPELILLCTRMYYPIGRGHGRQFCGLQQWLGRRSKVTSTWMPGPKLYQQAPNHRDLKGRVIHLAWTPVPLLCGPFLTHDPFRHFWQWTGVSTANFSHLISFFQNKREPLSRWELCML